jgi:LmbE family N-acetylglucosaminyl deacetylase
MNQSQFTRRALLAGLGPVLLRAQAPASPAARLLSVVCVGGHPDDPESGCGGTIARFSEAGHRITIVYLTRGERGISGKSLEEAAAIRTAEAQQACRILGARPVFAGQIDGATEFNQARVEEFSKLLAAASPDIVFTQWPVDTHMDHQVASLLTLRAYYASRRPFRLYFYEVDAGAQTQAFRPTDYVDISSVLEKKKAALFAHKSQDGEGIYRKHHRPMEEFRGREAQTTAAEAFVHLASDGSPRSLPLL